MNIEEIEQAITVDLQLARAAVASSSSSQEARTAEEGYIPDVLCVQICGMHTSAAIKTTPTTFSENGGPAMADAAGPSVHLCPMLVEARNFPFASTHTSTAHVLAEQSMLQPLYCSHVP